MTSFQLSISPSRRVATRFIDSVRRSIQRALIESRLTQSEVARRIGVHRSVINREIRGQKDMTLGRVAELTYALGMEPIFRMRVAEIAAGANVPPPNPPEVHTSTTSEFEHTPPELRVI